MIDYLQNSSEVVYSPRKATLYCDVDGTLVSQSNHLWSQVIEEVHAFVADGFGFTLATGRNLAGVQRLIPELPITNPLVLCNGAYVYDDKLGTAVTTEIAPSIAMDIVGRLRLIPDCIVYIDTSDCIMWVSSSKVLTEEYVLTEQLNPRVFSKVDEVIAGHKVIKIGARSNTKQAEVSLTKVQEEIQTSYPDELNTCFSSENYVEFMSAGVSKWFGIQVSQTMRPKKPTSILAVGDHYNDIEMISNADVGIAMGNAVPELKQCADYCIGRVEDLALPNFLRFLRRSATLPRIGIV